MHLRETIFFFMDSNDIYILRSFLENRGEIFQTLHDDNILYIFIPILMTLSNFTLTTTSERFELIMSDLVLTRV